MALHITRRITFNPAGLLAFFMAAGIGAVAYPWVFSFWMTYLAAGNPIVIAPWVGAIMGVLPLSPITELFNYSVNDKPILILDMGSGGFWAIATWIFTLCI